MARYVEKIISSGETLQSLAQKYLKDYTRWMEIAETNSLKYPYIVDSVEKKKTNPDNLKTVGDTLFIKLSDEEANLQIQGVYQNSIEDKEQIYGLALGRDLSIVPSQQIVRQRGSGDNIFSLFPNYRGGLKMTDGISNLKQALLVRLLTAKGSYVGHPEFGSEIHKYLGNKNTPETADLIDIEIERTLRTDGRVKRVEVGEHRITRNTYTGTFYVTPISIEEAFDFVISMEYEGPVVLL